MQKKQLLVIDDEPGVCLLLEHYLGDDFEVVTRENGLDACMWLAEGNVPTLVLADIEMPVMDGWEFLRRMRADAATRDVPCMMVSGKSKSLYYIQSHRLGANGFIAKPFTARELQEKLARFIETEHTH